MLFEVISLAATAMSEPGLTTSQYTASGEAGQQILSLSRTSMSYVVPLGCTFLTKKESQTNRGS